MANLYPYTGYSSATNTNLIYTIGTTWDYATSAPRPVEWNGAVIRYGPPAVVPAVVPAPEPLSPIDWLRRRVEEIRVDLAA